MAILDWCDDTLQACHADVHKRSSYHETWRNVAKLADNLHGMPPPWLLVRAYTVTIIWEHRRCEYDANVLVQHG